MSPRSVNQRQTRLEEKQTRLEEQHTRLKEEQARLEQQQDEVQKTVRSDVMEVNDNVRQTEEKVIDRVKRTEEKVSDISNTAKGLENCLTGNKQPLHPGVVTFRTSVPNGVKIAESECP